MIFPAFVLSIDILTNASSPNLVFVYRLETKNTESSSIKFNSEGMINFSFNCCLSISIISLKNLKKILFSLDIEFLMKQ